MLAGPCASPPVRDRLRCPSCHAKLVQLESGLQCSQCGAAYPVVDGIPVLIDETASLFGIADILATERSGPPVRFLPGARRWVRHNILSLNKNVDTRGHFSRLRRELLKRSARPLVLVIGSGTEHGIGTETLQHDAALQIVESDVAIGPRIAIVCDCHELPFDDNTFDGVIIQAVLEHVVDPFRCVAEIHRVLVPGGIVHSETPFMQQVHMGRHDFTRFTRLGHRRLFRRFGEIESGVVCGPGMALAWAWRYWLWSLVRSRRGRRAMYLLSGLTAFWLPYLDPLLADTPGADDAASGFWFMGYKSDEVLSDRELVKQYRGGV